MNLSIETPSMPSDTASLGNQFTAILAFLIPTLRKSGINLDSSKVLVRVRQVVKSAPVKLVRLSLRV